MNRCRIAVLPYCHDHRVHVGHAASGSPVVNSALTPTALGPNSAILPCYSRRNVNITDACHFLCKQYHQKAVV